MTFPQDQAAPVRSQRNRNGQAIGLKGQRTRRRLVDATVRLIETVPLRDLRMSDIARAADVASGTFYLYFDDVAEAVLAALGEISQSTPFVLGMLRQEWTLDDARDRAQALVEAYMENWAQHRHLFRVRNLTAEEGEPRFARMRLLSIQPFLQLLTEKIGAAQAAGRVSPHVAPQAMAGALLAMLERLAATWHPMTGEPAGRRSQIMTAAAEMLVLALGFGAAGVPAAAPSA